MVLSRTVTMIYDRSEEIRRGDKMSRHLGILFTLLLAIVPTAHAQMPMQTMSGLLNLAQTIPLPTEGYMDRLAVDLQGQRLFICGEAVKSLVVVDLRAGKVIHETKGLAASPKKPIYIPETNEVWVTMTDSTVVVISGTTYEETKTVILAKYGTRGGGR